MVPVVSATLTTRTYKEFGDDFPHDTERLTVDPVFVVVDAAPDLTCRRCGGAHPSEYINDPPHTLCPTCDGTGVSPVYVATWQWRALPEFKVGDVWHAPGSDTTANRLFAAIGRTEADYADAFERRQVVEWRATDVTVLPVVGPPGRLRIEFWPHRDKHRVMLTERGQVYRTNPDGGPPLDVTDEPWAVDLRPGQFVLRLDGWEHLQQPHTEMACKHGRFSPHYAEVCDDSGRKPLSVPDGVLSWMELV